MAERAHWGKFTKLKEGSEHLLADAGRKLHGLWHLRDGQADGVSVSSSKDGKQISLDLTWAEVFRAPGEVRTTLSRLGIGPDTATRISLGLKKAYGGITDTAYGFSLEIHPIVDHKIDDLKKGMHAVTGYAEGGGERLLCLRKTLDHGGFFTYILPRVDESEELKRLMEPLADFVVNVVEGRLSSKRV